MYALLLLIVNIIIIIIVIRTHSYPAKWHDDVISALYSMPQNFTSLE